MEKLREKSKLIKLLIGVSLLGALSGCLNKHQEFKSLNMKQYGIRVYETPWGGLPTYK